MLYPQLQLFCDSLTQQFNTISEERKVVLQTIAQYIQAKQQNNQETNLVYICTHNSRRSHFGQVWARVASHYYNIKPVHTFSGGTEATAFNPNAIKALQQQGFVVTTNEIETITNPTYTVYFTEEFYSTCFSKVYDNDANPKKNFAAIMTCGSADTNCPYIPNCELRVSTTYKDPKASDNTAQQEETYYNRSKEIATEIFYLFSLIH